MTHDEAHAVLDRSLRSLLEGHGPGADALAVPTTLLRDLGVSSLLLFRFVSTLEEEGGLALDDDDVDSRHFHTVGDVVDLLTRYELGSVRRPPASLP